MKVKKILVSQPKPANVEKSPYFELSQKYGVEIDFRKFIKIEGVPAKEFRKDKISILEHTAIIMTSRNSVDHFFRVCKEMRIDVPDTMKYFCVSEAIAFYLQKYVQFRKRKIFHGKQNFTQLMDLIKKHKDEKFLLPCSDIHKQEFSEQLEVAGIHYNKAIIYRTLASDLSDVDIQEYDLLIFFSPSGVKSLFKNFPDYKQEDALIAAFGPTTVSAVEQDGLVLNIKAPTKTAPSMAMAIEQHLEELKKASRKKK
ncbi:MAG: uroporphyrinogen-III synthase [Bacteroidales bacterium]|nr:uroporphyrinogen-III synthase [Bacteroidales bacterium]